jgi:hypothetical protein
MLVQFHRSCLETGVVYAWLIRSWYADDDLPYVMPPSLDHSGREMGGKTLCSNTMANITLRSGEIGERSAVGYCTVEAALYWQLSIAAGLLIFQTRAPHRLFFLSRPGAPLVVAFLVAQTVVLVLVLVENPVVSEMLEAKLAFAILGVAVGFAVLMDVVKIGLFKLIHAVQQKRERATEGSASAATIVTSELELSQLRGGASTGTAADASTGTAADASTGTAADASAGTVADASNGTATAGSGVIGAGTTSDTSVSVWVGSSQRGLSGPTPPLRSSTRHISFV